MHSTLLTTETSLPDKSKSNSLNHWCISTAQLLPSLNQEPDFMSVSQSCNRGSGIKCVTQEYPSGNIWTTNWNKSKYEITALVKRKGVHRPKDRQWQLLNKEWERHQVYDKGGNYTNISLIYMSSTKVPQYFNFNKLFFNFLQQGPILIFSSIYLIQQVPLIPNLIQFIF